MLNFYPCDARVSTAHSCLVGELLFFLLVLVSHLKRPLCLRMPQKKHSHVLGASQDRGVLLVSSPEKGALKRWHPQRKHRSTAEGLQLSFRCGRPEPFLLTSSTFRGLPFARMVDA